MRTFLTIIFVLLIFNGKAQTKSFSASGIVTDSTGKEAMVNASVCVRDVKSGLKRISLTNNQGYFIINNLAEGEYNLDISYVGFTSFEKMIRLKADEVIYIRLQKANVHLANVSVSSEKKLLKQMADKITFNVSESAVSASENLYNILLKVPGVVESNGVLFYQGKPVSILLDGKSNNLSGEDLKAWLSGIFGTNTDKMEILLNPPSRFDAQGGIVINIRSQKNKNYGFNNTVTLGIGKGIYYKAPASYSMNYRDSTINIYGGYDYNYTRQYFHLNALLAFNSDPSKINMSDHNIRTQYNHSFRLGVDNDLNKRTTIGLLIRVANNFRKRKIFDKSLSQSGTSAPDSVVNVNILTDASFVIPSFNFYFKRKLSATGTELVVNVDYWGMSKKWSDDIEGSYSNLSSNVVSGYTLNNSSPAQNSVRSVTADYFSPLKNGNIETGVKLTESRTDNNVLWERLINNEWKTDSSKTNHFIYKENIYAVYGSAFKTYKKWTVQSGLRVEFSRSAGNSITLKMITKRKYDDLFPTLNIQYKASKKHLLSFTYKRSIRRFGFDIINPFINLQGQYSYHKGNPYIRPSYFNSLGINWSYKNSLVVNSNFSLVKDPISYAYEKGPDNTSHGTNLNFGSGRLLNASVNYTAKLLKGKLTTINTLNFSHSELPDFNSHIQQNNSYSLSSINTIALPSQIMFEFSGLYNSALLDGTVWQSEFYGISAGIAKPFFKSKGSLKLSCTDILNTQILYFKTNGRGINILSDWKVESRFVNMLFTYRFGNQNVKQNKNRKTGIEDEKARMGGN
jgi:hypothetical protein